MSAIVRYISDTHFGHKNMAIKRGFNDEFEMGELLVSRWNRVVRKHDTTYILGDITMEKTSEYYWLDMLNGYIKIIQGNHDNPQHTHELLKHVNNVGAYRMLSDKKYGGIVFSHFPIHPCELTARWKYNIHGHMHNKSVGDHRYINVSAEMIDYTPRTLDELMSSVNAKYYDKRFNLE